jgi:hypothetical protein
MHGQRGLVASFDVVRGLASLLTLNGVSAPPDESLDVQLCRFCRGKTIM